MQGHPFLFLVFHFRFDKRKFGGKARAGAMAGDMERSRELLWEAVAAWFSA